MTTATDRPGRRSEDPLVRQTKKATQPSSRRRGTPTIRGST